MVIMYASAYAQSAYYCEKLFKEDANGRAQLLNDYVSFMTDKSKGDIARNYYRKKCLSLFFSKGYTYEESDTSRQGVMVKIISRKDTSTSTSLLVRDFLEKYYDNSEKIHYELKKVEIIGVSQRGISKTDEDGLLLFREQHAPYVIYQFDDDRVSEVDTKPIRCYFNLDLHEPVSDYFWEYWIGDIEVVCDSL